MSASLPKDTPEGASSSLLQLGDARSSSETGPGGAPGGADRRDAARAAERELADELLKFVRAKLRALGVAPSDGFASSSSSSPRGGSSSARGRAREVWCSERWEARARVLVLSLIHISEPTRPY